MGFWNKAAKGVSTWAKEKNAVREAEKLEKARKLREAELAKNAEQALKSKAAEAETIKKAKDFQQKVDEDWNAEVAKQLKTEMDYIRNANNEEVLKHFIDTFGLSRDDAIALYNNPTKSKLRAHYNEKYKDAYYRSAYKQAGHDWKSYNYENNYGYKRYPKTEVPINEAPNPEVPKDPSNTGLILKKALSGAGNLAKGTPAFIFGNGGPRSAAVGALGGAYATDENADPDVRLRNILTGALLGFGLKKSYNGLRRNADKIGMNIPSIGLLTKEGLVDAGILTPGLYSNEIKNGIGNVYNALVPKKSNDSNAPSPQMPIPEQAPVNPNWETPVNPSGGAPVDTYQQDALEYERDPYSNYNF